MSEVSKEEPAPLLVFGYGNPGRGDDALGYLCIQALESQALPFVECQTDMQLQVEHVTDLRKRRYVLFIDADMSCTAPYWLEPLTAWPDTSYSSHAMSPAALLQAFQDVYHEAPPPAELLHIRGYRFELGKHLSRKAAKHLEQALALINLQCHQKYLEWTKDSH